MDLSLVLATLSLLATTIVAAIGLRSRLPVDRAQVLSESEDATQTAWELAEGQIHFLERRVKEMTSEMTNLKAKVSELEMRAWSAEQRLGQKDGEVAQLQRERDALQAALKAAQDRLGQFEETSGG